MCLNPYPHTVHTICRTRRRRYLGKNMYIILYKYKFNYYIETKTLKRNEKLLIKRSLFQSRLHLLLERVKWYGGIWTRHNCPFPRSGLWGQHYNWLAGVRINGRVTWKRLGITIIICWRWRKTTYNKKRIRNRRSRLIIMLLYAET